MADENEFDRHTLEAENFHNPRVSNEAYNFLAECLIYMIKEYEAGPSCAWIPVLGVDNDEDKALLKRLSAELKVDSAMVKAQYPYYPLNETVIKELTNEQ